MRTLSQEAWVAAALSALAKGGLDALRIEPLAQQLGITKGSFYHHFPNREALHQAMLATWEKAGTTQIIEMVDASEAPAADRLRQLAQRTMRADPTSDAIENAIRAWATTDAHAATVIQRVDERRLDYVIDLLREAGMPRAKAVRRARLLYRIIIGEFVWRSAGGPTSIPADVDDVVDLVLQ